MREARDAGGQALLMAVELADLDRGADRGMGDVDPRQGYILLEQGRARAARHHADLGASDMDAIAMADRIIGVDVEADELVARMFLALEEGRFADEVVALRLEWDGEGDAGLERIGLIGEFIVSEDKAGLDAQHVECFETEGCD